MIDSVLTDSPLVSIVVVTYNSALFVLETLESARLQTYGKIELVVSDDCSSDNTADICRKWMIENKGRFVRTDLIVSAQNTGIASNCNRGIQNAKGEWVKIIAGDDILLKSCIQTNIDYSIKNDAGIVFSRHVWFKVNASGKKMTNSDPNSIDAYWEDLNKTFFLMNSRSQYLKLLKKNYPPASTIFINRELLVSLGGFEEMYPLLEDYPLWLKATKKGYKLHFVDTETVLYRKHENAISNYSKLNRTYIVNRYAVYRRFRLNKNTALCIFMHISENVNYYKNLILLKTGKRNLLVYLLTLIDPFYIKDRFFRKRNTSNILNGEFVENEQYDSK